MTALVRLRWREDASGYLAPYAGQWASPSSMTRDQAEEILRLTPNGTQLEVVEVTE